MVPSGLVVGIVSAAAFLQLHGVTALGYLTYECYPNATLKIQNPGNFTMVTARNSESACNTTWADSIYSVLYVNGCEMNVGIMVSFSNENVDMSHVISGKNMYMISCKDIPVQGAPHNVSANLDVSLSSKSLSVYPTFAIWSDIYEFHQEVHPTSVQVGEQLNWVISAETSLYRYRPTTCWAYAGMEISETAHKKKLIENGCTLDDDLVSNFLVRGSNSTDHRRHAVLYAFRFYTSEYVTMLCEVKVCKYETGRSFCDLDDCTNQVRKRAVDYDAEGEEVMLTNVLKITDDSVCHSASKMFVWISPMLALYVLVVNV